MFGLGLDYGLGFSSDIRLRQDPQLRVSPSVATTISLSTSIGNHCFVGIEANSGSVEVFCLDLSCLQNIGTLYSNSPCARPVVTSRNVRERELSN